MRRMGIFYIMLLCTIVIALTIFGKMYTSVNLNARYADMKTISSLTQTGQCFEIRPGVFHKNGFEMDTNTNTIMLSNNKQLILSNTKVESVAVVNVVELVTSAGSKCIPIKGVHITLSHKIDNKTRSWDQMFIKVGD